jgi:starch synthase (maltosyl-transferring)
MLLTPSGPPDLQSRENSRLMQDGLRIYNLFPLLAGTIEDWTQQLPRIAGMGFNAVYVNPFHYAGFSGSLYAVKDYYRLNPKFRANGVADDELLRGFTDAARGQGLRVMMDLVVNHTSKDSELLREHPDWFVRGADGAPVSPSAIDPANASNVTVWGDLAEIDFGRAETRDAIVGYFADVVRHYLTLGFTGFRCDAAYKVPGEVWRALIDSARAENGEAVFCAETLGAPLDQVRQLRPAGFDYLYNSVKWWDWESPWLLEQYEAFRRIAPSIAFPESHDTERFAEELARSGITEPADQARWYRLAYAFAACFSKGVMMTMGYEWGATKRLDVVTSTPEDAGPKRFDLSDFISAMNGVKRNLPALNEEGPQRLLTTPADPVVALARRTEAGEEWAFIVVNTDAAVAREIDVDALLAAAEERNIVLSEATPGLADAAGVPLHLTLEPLQLRVLRGRALPGVARRPGTVERRGAAAHHPEWRASDRIVIEDLWPEIDCGRFPVKRIVGDTVELWADLFRDGHDKIAARVLYKIEGEAEWRSAPMAFYDNDRWVGRFVPDENARWRYTVEAWTDHWESWRGEVEKKRQAGQDIRLELIEGRALIEAALKRAADADIAAALRRVLRDFDAAEENGRAELALSRMVQQIMARCPDRSDAVRYHRELELVVDRPAARFAAWYEMFQRSQGTVPGQGATFDDCIRRLPEIRDLGFDVVYLVPIHPIGRINRKGRDNSLVATPGDPGSPYAIGAAEGGHKAVHPELGTLADFRRFVDAAERLGMEVALDFAVQCSPDHPWIREHTNWFVFRPDGTIKYAENPPRKYQDIVNVDFYNPDRIGLWTELRDTILFWVEQGVKTFRVDNPHTKPLPFWEWCIREVQASHPEVIFLAEAFTRPKPLKRLAKLGFTQSYSYFTWRNTKAELTEYLTELTQSSAKEYLRPNFFTNTPDILPHFLQEGGRPAFRIRFVLAATLSGVYGIYNGFELCENAALPGKEEYARSEKYEYKVWDWDRPGNIKDDIRKLNRFRRDNPALHLFTNLRFHPSGDDDILFYSKMTEDRSNVVFVAVNLDPHQPHEAVLDFPLHDMGVSPNDEFRLDEVFTGAATRWRGAHHRMRLDPHENPAAVWRLAPQDML